MEILFFLILIFFAFLFFFFFLIHLLFKINLPAGLEEKKFNQTLRQKQTRRCFVPVYNQTANTEKTLLLEKNSANNS